MTDHQNLSLSSEIELSDSLRERLHISLESPRYSDLYPDAPIPVQVFHNGALSDDSPLAEEESESIDGSLMIISDDTDEGDLSKRPIFKMDQSQVNRLLAYMGKKQAPYDLKEPRLQTSIKRKDDSGCLLWFAT